MDSGKLTLDGIYRFVRKRIYPALGAQGHIVRALIAGGAAGNHTVTGIQPADTIIMVLHYTTSAALADLTSEFSITAASTINNTGGTDTSSDQLLVLYEDNTP